MPTPPTRRRRRRGAGDQQRGSQILDSITIGPQTTFTIDPLYGTGSRQQAVGDIIWHCHLYPHFHHGMWGMWRSFDRQVDGSRPYPDGTPAPALVPLPGREPPSATPQTPGFPWFIPGTFPQKSPPPPAIRDEDLGARRRLLRMPKHTELEQAAFDPGCVARPRPGAVFNDLDAMAMRWNREAGLAPPRVLSYDVESTTSRIDYNSDGWHDRNGHVYRLTGIRVTTLDEDGEPTGRERFDPPDDGDPRPFFPRANHGDIVEWRMINQLGAYPADHFDLGIPPVECGLHVHLVKFDVLSADGSASGWNYLSGASVPDMVPELPGPGLPRNVSLHRWIVDEEFGTTFLHDHLAANYRQRRGLSGALIAEPHGSQWLDLNQESTAWNAAQAVVLPPTETGLPPHREACLTIGDFLPLYNRHDRPLNPPNRLGGVSDPGVMGVNYRNAPMHHRGEDPSLWFSSTGQEDEDLPEGDPRPRDPDTGTVAPWDPDDDGHGGHGGEDDVVGRGHHFGHRDDNWREYWWYADEALAPPTADEGPGQVCYLYDMADIRNHRHHGLIGALVVLPGDVTPLHTGGGQERWTGTAAALRSGSSVVQERVLFLQDGLRHFVAGNPNQPVPDSEPGIDPVDAGQKGINYRSAVTGRRMLRPEDPPTPLLTADVGDTVWLHVVGAADKPRNHSLTVHGHAWPANPWLGSASRWTGSLSGISAATTRDVELLAEQPGDHAYRTGVFRWHLPEGMWGILRVNGLSAGDGAATLPITSGRRSPAR